MPWATTGRRRDWRCRGRGAFASPRGGCSAVAPRMNAPACSRRVDALFERRPFAVAVFFVIAVSFTFPLYLRPMNLGHGDWLYFHFLWEAARKSYLDFHAVLWWNPYYCGGNLGIPFGRSDRGYL